ncbi:hypothetical protein D3C72_1663010 [compost metagenome]
MAGWRPVSAISAAMPVGEAPYRITPGRTQARCACGCQSTAAELDRLASPGRLAVAVSKASIWCAMPRALSASEKCVMCTILPTQDSPRARSQAAR